MSRGEEGREKYLDYRDCPGKYNHVQIKRGRGHYSIVAIAIAFDLNLIALLLLTSCLIRNSGITSRCVVRKGIFFFFISFIFPE